MFLTHAIEAQKTRRSDLQAQIEAIQYQQSQIDAHLAQLASLESKMEAATKMIQDVVSEITSHCPDELPEYHSTVSQIFSSTKLEFQEAEPQALLADVGVPLVPPMPQTTLPEVEEVVTGKIAIPVADAKPKKTRKPKVAEVLIEEPQTEVPGQTNIFDTIADASAERPIVLVDEIAALEAEREARISILPPPVTVTAPVVSHRFEVGDRIRTPHGCECTIQSIAYDSKLGRVATVGLAEGRTAEYPVNQLIYLGRPPAEVAPKEETQAQFAITDLVQHKTNGTVGRVTHVNRYSEKLVYTVRWSPTNASQEHAKDLKYIGKYEEPVQFVVQEPTKEVHNFKAGDWVVVPSGEICQISRIEMVGDRTYIEVPEQGTKNAYVPTDLKPTLSRQAIKELGRALVGKLAADIIALLEEQSFEVKRDAIAFAVNEINVHSDNALREWKDRLPRDFKSHIVFSGTEVSDYKWLPERAFANLIKVMEMPQF